MKILEVRSAFWPVVDDNWPDSVVAMEVLSETETAFTCRKYHVPNSVETVDVPRSDSCIVQEREIPDYAIAEYFDNVSQPPGQARRPFSVDTIRARRQQNIRERARALLDAYDRDAARAQSVGEEAGEVVA